MLDLIREAAGRLNGVIEPTPLVFSSSLSRSFGFECYLKLENLQKTGSFKVRGAYNRISALGPDQRKRGVITASSGNHAQGVAWAAGLLDTRAVIVMPGVTPIIKQVATRSYGGEVILHGNLFSDAYAHALELAKAGGLTFIPPYDDELVIAGQGTIGLEIMEALPGTSAVVVPVGGGGLISGIAAAVKGIKKDVRVTGVEAEVSARCTASLRAGRPVSVEPGATIADGTAVKGIGEKTFPLIKEYVDDVAAVGEDCIAAAILKFIERKKLVVEGAGALPLAAAMDGRLSGASGKVVLVVSGGNIDVTTLDRVIRLGLLKEGRIMRLETEIPDIPGALAELSALLAGLKANIFHILHEREAVDVPVGRVRIEVLLEVEGRAHSVRVLNALRDGGYRV